MPDGGLRYAGHVGTGFTQAMLTDLARRLARCAGQEPGHHPLPALYARGAQWVQPRLAGKVAFTESTRDQGLRHPRLASSADACT